jgi:universal stress protein A
LWLVKAVNAMKKLFDTILCPVDFDPPSMAALDLACKIAEQNGSTLSVLHVAPLPIGASEISPLPMDPYPVWEQAAKVQLEKVAAEHLEGRGIAYKLETRSGEAAVGILNQAHESNADLVVMATHGRKGMRHFLIGSVAERVIRQSSCPVLVAGLREV